jgi:uncharacterized membrane protein
MPITKRHSIIKIILLLSLTFLTTISLWIFVNRYKLQYNSEGCYFDEATATVYHKQAVEVFGIISFILFVLTIATIIWIIKTIKNVRT